MATLLNAGADPFSTDARGNSVLLTAVNASALDAARTLLMSNQAAVDLPRLFVACPTEDKTTALIQAVKMADICKFLNQVSFWGMAFSVSPEGSTTKYRVCSR